MSIVEIDFKKSSKLEYILNNHSEPPLKKHQIISPREACQLYFPDTDNVPIFVVTGGQRGDECKGRTTRVVKRIVNGEDNQFPDKIDFLPKNPVRWASAECSTNNAGKGVETVNEDGEKVRFSLHICPATLADPDVRNYIREQTQVNLFVTKNEVLDLWENTGRDKLYISDKQPGNYHLMVDLRANINTPIDRVDDVVGKADTMGSTVAGATSAYRHAAGKSAPLIEHALYDHEQFERLVEKQIVELGDSLLHDQEFMELDITDRISLGYALRDPVKFKKSKRLQVLKEKLTEEEVEFFCTDTPVEFLLASYLRILSGNYFHVGDTTRHINHHIECGESGILEGVQSTLLSGPIKYSRNRTSAGTHSAAIIANANLDLSKTHLYRLLVFKMGNTSVGGHDATMSGFIPQDALSKLVGKHPETRKEVSLEKLNNIQDLFKLAGVDQSEVHRAYQQVHKAFYTALQNGHSLHHSSVYFKPLDSMISLAEANALLSAIVFNEQGETSGRARIMRLDDQVETGFVMRYERGSLQFRNAVDRGLLMDKLGVISAYQALDYPGYEKNEVIFPGMPLRQEHLTVRGCVPIIRTLPSYDSLNSDGSNNLEPGDMLHPNLSKYLETVAGDQTVMAISFKPGPNGVRYIREKG